MSKLFNLRSAIVEVYQNAIIFMEEIGG